MNTKSQSLDESALSELLAQEPLGVALKRILAEAGSSYDRLIADLQSKYDAAEKLGERQALETALAAMQVAQKKHTEPVRSLIRKLVTELLAENGCELIEPEQPTGSRRRKHELPDVGRVLSLAGRPGGVTGSELIQELECEKKVISRLCEKLITEGKLVRKGRSKKGNHYEAVAA